MPGSLAAGRNTDGSIRTEAGAVDSRRAVAVGGALITVQLVHPYVNGLAIDLGGTT